MPACNAGLEGLLHPNAGLKAPHYPQCIPRVPPGSLAPDCRWRTSISHEDGVAGDYALQLAGVGAIDYGDERVVIDVAESGIERQVRVKTGEGLRGENGAEGEFAFAFLEKALELIAVD